MKDLITLNNQDSPEVTMTSKEIAEITSKQHKNVLVDIRKIIKELENQPAENSARYQVSEYKDKKGETRVEYTMNKKAVLILTMGYSIALRIKVADRLEELEEQLKKKQFNLPQDYEAAVVSLLGEIRENKKLKAQALLDKPKVAFADMILATDDEVGASTLARLVSNVLSRNINTKEFLKELRDKDILCSGTKDWNQPYKHFRDNNYMTVREDVVNSRVYPTTYYTPKGQALILELTKKGKLFKGLLKE